MIDLLRHEATARRDDGLRGWDGMAIEIEYAELLNLLVRTLRPGIVVEAGTGRGVCSVFLAEALVEHGGFLYTYEDDPEYAAKARIMLRSYPAQVVDGDSREYQGPVPGLLFLDSGPSTRSLEIKHWRRALAGTDTLVAVHDANRPYALPPGGTLLPAGDGLWLGRF